MLNPNSRHYLARNYVERGQEIVERQRKLIVLIRERGRDATLAETLLAQFERTLATFERDLADIERAALL